jgi:DNA-binding CsgD family transcriptional regulator
LRGRLDVAAELADEALERSEQLGGNDINVIPLSVRAQIHAYAGREDDARRDAAAVLEAAERLKLPSMMAWPIMTIVFLDVTKGDHVAALATWERVSMFLEDRANTDPVNAFGLPDAIEAMVAVGRIEAADRWLAPWEERGERMDRAWVLAVSARSRAILLAARGDLAAAVEVGERSMQQYERLPMPFERARTLLLLGQLYRRKRQKRKAIDAFNEALEAFTQIGATTWAERVNSELSRSKVGHTGDVGLTSSEQQVADLAATGMTNNDIAAALFISPKTVEHHIGRVYRKLGIRNRAELGQRMRDS